MTRNALRRTLTFLPLVSGALFFTLAPSTKLASQAERTRTPYLTSRSSYRLFVRPRPNTST